MRDPSRPLATAIGFTAVLLWALLAVLTVWTQPTPPLLLNAICFAIGGAVGLIWCASTGGLGQLRRVPLGVYAFGTVGLFGYHFLYFSALRMAPPAEAGLIAYLWPLLIVLFSGLLPGEQLRKGHIIGALISFVGAGILVTSGGAGFDLANLPGYGLALICALFWSTYSVVSRRFGAIPTASVTVFCLASAVLSALAHLALEETVWPVGFAGWAALAALGLGPVGLAFFVWDVGVKRGDIQMLGVASYAAPLLSTLVLVVVGIAAPTGALLVAALMITGGAALAGWASNARPSGG
ncbi:aromatic amino acid exporter YddG [Flavimaricola marinus]|uniref:Aromatic amino acid exporter YddG n=1 Tax=Flavimaricola marinus TaxID=1819565 RepID=A0A238LBS2_9RHOB|nr:EamA family transporter [Flavimaricola marinus]SMY06855.1 Aromatic amino acid exporter YddG [Flavimaricola marinus]